MGGEGYDMLIRMNNRITWRLTRIGREKYSFSNPTKDSVKKAVKIKSNFEDTAKTLAIERNYHYVVCGHIHQPQIQTVTTRKGSCVYLNAGDWIESLSALEYNNGDWSLFLYEKEKEKLGAYPEQEAIFS